MAKCPNCGTEVEKPVKSWQMKPKRRKGPTILIELYECPKCGTKFRTGKKIG
ncbi:chorismate-binding protein [Candidatus Bathyarchaeota archaeon]|nr:MAG: chorismate-binding protein [Candidatus Bathyarchaeota archaeon]